MTAHTYIHIDLNSCKLLFIQVNWANHQNTKISTQNKKSDQHSNTDDNREQACLYNCAVASA